MQVAKSEGSAEGERVLEPRLQQGVPIPGGDGASRVRRSVGR